jgi:hypothetical protein
MKGYGSNRNLLSYVPGWMNVKAVLRIFHTKKIKAKSWKLGKCFFSLKKKSFGRFCQDRFLKYEKLILSL